MALCLLAAPAVAIVLPCETNEGGMRVSTAHSFGYDGSGFVTEEYHNAVVEGAKRDAQGRREHMPAPLPQLEGFRGYRVIDCKSGEFLAIDQINQYQDDQLLATEFLRTKVQGKRPIAMADVNRAVDALYKGQNVAVLRLRATEQTCSCKVFGGQ